MTTNPRLRYLSVALLAVASLLVGASDAFATHFRYGVITWQIVDPAQPRIVKIRFDAAFRWSYFGGPPVGTTVDPGGSNITITGPGGFTQTVGSSLRVTSINTTQDYLVGTQEFTVTLPNTEGTYNVVYLDCCRISSLKDNNNDKDYRIETAITLRLPPHAINQPPTAGTLPIIVLARNQPASFQIPASDPNADAIAFRLSTTAESGMVKTAPDGLTLAANGRINWTPTVNGLYALQARVSDPLGAFTVVDFLFDVKDAVGQLPVVRINGSTSALTLTSAQGTPITFTVQTSDPENTPVLLSSGSVPAGATMTPSLPLSAVNASTTFNWTPQNADVGNYVLNFAALDGDGRQSSNSITLTVINNPPTIMCTPSGDQIEATGPGGAVFTLTVDVNDIDHDPLTVKIFTDNVQRLNTPLLTPPAGAGYSDTYALGTHTYRADVTDGLSGSGCAGLFSIVDTTPPSIILTPGDITMPASSAAGAVAMFTAEGVDAVDPAPTVTCTHLSGETFPIGVTPVTCTATDASHNQFDVTFTVTVEQLPQSIDFGPLGTKTFGDLPFNVSAIPGASGTPVTFTAAGNCSVAGTLVTLTGAGSCTITAHQAGNALYLAAPDVPQSFAINQATQAIVFDPLGTKTYGEPPFTVSATGGGSGNPVTFTASGMCTVAGSLVTLTAVGSCTITAHQAGNANYLSAADVVRSFTIGKTPQTIAFAAPASPVMFASSFSVNLTASSGLPVSLAVAGVCSLNGSTITMTSGTGTCSITASQAGNATFLAAASITRVVAAAKAPLSITADDKVIYLGDPLPVLTATYAGFLNGETAASLDVPVQLATTATPTSGVGTYPIVASGAADANYVIAFHNGTLTIGGLGVLKANVRAALAALLPTPATAPGKPPKEPWHEVEEAIKFIDKSLAPKLWIDSSHLSEKGHEVFDNEKEAVKHLMHMTDPPGPKGGPATAPPAVVTDAIVTLTAIDRKLAEVAIADARAASRTLSDPRRLRDVLEKIDKAGDELDKGDGEADHEDMGHAIEHYREAWKKAQEAIRKAGGDK